MNSADAAAERDIRRRGELENDIAEVGAHLSGQVEGAQAATGCDGGSIAQDTPSAQSAAGPPENASEPVDLDVVREHLGVLWPNGLPPAGLVTLYRKRARHTPQFDDLGAAAQEIATGRWPYLTMAAMRRLERGRGTIAHVVALPGLWGDVDIYGGEHAATALPTEAQALGFLGELPLRPTRILHSGGGLYPLWLFEEPWILASDTERDEAKRIARGWAEYLIAAAGEHGWHLDNVSALNHVLRPTGTWNAKYAPLRLVRVVQSDGPRYELAAFLGFTAPKEKSSPRANRSTPPAPSSNGQASKLKSTQFPPRIAAYVASAVDAETRRLVGAAPGTRNTTLASVAASIGQIMVGGLIERGEAERAVTTAAIACGLDTDPAVGARGIEDTLCRQFEWAASNPRTKWPGFVAAWLRGEWPPKVADDGRPRIVHTHPGGTVPLHKLTAVALGALGERCADRLYSRSGSLVRVTHDCTPSTDGIARGDALRIAEAPESIVTEELGRAAQWIRVSKSKQTGDLIDIETWCPAPVVKAIHARGEWPTLRPLVGVVESPTMRPDGSILGSGGYDPQTGLLVALRRDYPAVSDAPTREDAERAVAKLLAPFAEFPFVTDDDRAALLAYMFAIAVRHAIPGPVPMTLATAPSFGAGKSLLVKAGALGMTGALPDIMSPPGGRHSDAEAEMRKRITALLREGARVVNLDNFADGSEIASDSLAALLTEDVWTDRILGKSERVRIPARTVWAATGVNLSVRSDLARRCLSVAIDPGIERPEARRFAVEDLAEHVRERHPEMLVAALTVLRAHVVAGRPRHGAPSLGGFGGWDRMVRSAVVWATGLDPVATMSRLQEAAGDRDDLRALLELWRIDVGLAAVTVAQVLDRARPALREALHAVALGRDGGIDRLRLGHYLGSVAGRPVGGLRLVRLGIRDGVRAWRLDMDELPKAGGGGPAAEGQGDQGDQGDVCHSRARAIARTQAHARTRACEGGPHRSPSSPTSPFGPNGHPAGEAADGSAEEAAADPPPAGWREVEPGEVLLATLNIEDDGRIVSGPLRDADGREVAP